MTDKEKKMLPVLGVVLLFAVYWLFIKGGDDKPKKKGRARPPVTKPAPNKANPNAAKQPAVVKKGGVDAGVGVVKKAAVDAAPPRPPQQWTVAASSRDKVEWVAAKGRVIKDDIILKFRGYKRAERNRAGLAKRLSRQRAALNSITDKLRAAMRGDDRAGMRLYEKQVQGRQREVERTEAALERATRSADNLVVRAPGSGVFTPETRAGKRLKRGAAIGVVKE